MGTRNTPAPPCGLAVRESFEQWELRVLRDEVTDLGAKQGVLSGEDGPAYEIVNPEGRSRFALVCEHAGRRVPKSLGDLGLALDDFDRHIASDIGAAGVARAMVTMLDAPLVLQPYSRLVVDCNRSFEASDCFPEVSDTIAIPGNTGLSEEERWTRYREIHAPFHDTVTRLLDNRPQLAATMLVSVHSFTPRLRSTGFDRPWEVGLLFNRDDRLARRLLPALEWVRPGIVAAFNEPYKGGGDTDYTIPVHGERRGIEHVLVEIRNDLIASPDGQAEWATVLCAALRETIPEEVEQG